MSSLLEGLFFSTNAASRLLVNIWKLHTGPVIATYLGLVLIFAPIWKRCGTRLKIPTWVLIAHNGICVLLSFCCSVYPLFYAISTGDIFGIEPGDDLMISVFFVYWISKIVELLDTALIILRHSFRQLTFLHVFHHSTMALLGDYAYHTRPCPAVGFPLGMNSVVHVVLYSYYGLCAWRPQRSITWKKRITELQLIQFTIGLVQDYFGYRYFGFCVYIVFYTSFMIILFGNFYIRAYIVKQPRSHKPPYHVKDLEDDQKVKVK